MVKPELIASTGDFRCDRIAQGVIGVFEATFPNRVRGYYLRGSRASGTSIGGSDIDLFVIFKDRSPTSRSTTGHRISTIIAANSRPSCSSAFLSENAA